MGLGWVRIAPPPLYIVRMGQVVLVGADWGRQVSASGGVCLFYVAVADAELGAFLNFKKSEPACLFEMCFLLATYEVLQHRHKQQCPVILGWMGNNYALRWEDMWHQSRHFGRLG